MVSLMPFNTAVNLCASAKLRVPTRLDLLSTTAFARKWRIEFTLKTACSAPRANVEN
jgi:hypothetical protein